VGAVQDLEGWVPLDPVIVRVRKDIIWEEIIVDNGIKTRERNANSMFIVFLFFISLLFLAPFF
jgi:hypothetical protein